MAVKNQLAPKKDSKEQVVTFQSNGMEVKLTPTLVKKYMVSGNKDLVTFQEVAMFMNLCKFSGLNPWLKEAYCIKYSNNEPATLVVGKDAFLKRAEAHPQYDGYEAGIIVVDSEGSILYRKGTLKLENEKLIGGYAEVWRKDRSHSIRSEVSFEEYAGRKKDGSLNSQWGKKPATMIRKVALVQALRESFPISFGGMYSAEEQGETEPEFTVIPEQPDVLDQSGEPDVNEEEKAQDSEEPVDVAAALFN